MTLIRSLLCTIALAAAVLSPPAAAMEDVMVGCPMQDVKHILQPYPDEEKQYREIMGDSYRPEVNMLAIFKHNIDYDFPEFHSPVNGTWLLLSQKKLMDILPEINKAKFLAAAGDHHAANIIVRKVVRDSSSSVFEPYTLSHLLRFAGKLEHWQWNYEEAIAYFNASQCMYNTLWGGDSPWAASAKLWLAAAYFGKEDVKRAIALLEEVEPVLWQGTAEVVSDSSSISRRSIILSAANTFLNLGFQVALGEKKVLSQRLACTLIAWWLSPELDMPQSRSKKKPSADPCDDLAASLPSDKDVLFGLHISTVGMMNDSALGFVIRRTGRLEIRRLTEINSFFKHALLPDLPFGEAFQQENPDTGRRDLSHIQKKLGKEIFSMLKVLKKTDRVLFIASSSAQAFPLSKLMTPQGKYFAEVFNIQYLAGLSDLTHPWSINPRARQVLMVGDLDYGTTRDEANCLDHAAIRSQNLPDLCHLPGTRLELSTIRSLFRSELGFDATVLTGAAVTSEGIRAAIASPRILHLATHGLTDGISTQTTLGQPRTVGLALSGANSVADVPSLVRSPAFLSMDDIRELPLTGTELVVLSACWSARSGGLTGGRPRDLAYATRLAGARYVVATLWPVSDHQTAEFMMKFYEVLRDRFDEMHRLDAPYALWQTQRSFMEAAPDQSGDPEFWAAFVVFGL